MVSYLIQCLCTITILIMATVVAGVGHGALSTQRRRFSEGLAKKEYLTDFRNGVNDQDPMPPPNFSQVPSATPVYTVPPSLPNPNEAQTEGPSWEATLKPTAHTFSKKPSELVGEDTTGTPSLQPSFTQISSFPSWSPTFSALTHAPASTPNGESTWNLVGIVNDSNTMTELMGSAIDISGDGSVVWIGAFNFTNNALPQGAGRIRRFERRTGMIVDVEGDTEFDALGYEVSGSEDGTRVVGFASAIGKFSLWEFNESASIRLATTITLDGTWDYCLVFFDLSKDGNWLSMTGTQVLSGEEVVWSLRVYQVVVGDSGLDLRQFGNDIPVENSFAVFPSLYSVDISRDGSVIAVAKVGTDGTQAAVYVFERQGNEYTHVGNTTDPVVVSSQGAGNDDYFARNVEVRVAQGYYWLVIGWEIENQVLILTWNGEAWSISATVSAYVELGVSSEFGFDIDLNEDATRMIIGAPCFNACKGASLVFERESDGVEWEILGSIMVGDESSYFGQAVAMSSDGSFIAIGAPQKCSDNGICGGAVYVFQYGSGESTVTRMPAPAPTDLPIATDPPMTGFYWAQVNEVISLVDEELFSSTISLSGDGSILFVGAFENNDFSASSGRILRIDLSNDNEQAGFYGNAFDFSGFDLSIAADGSRVVGFLSSQSLMIVAEFSSVNGLRQTAELQTEMNSMPVSFSLSSDGKWLAVVGLVEKDDAEGTSSILTILTFHDTSTGFSPFGVGISLETMQTIPWVDIDLLADGSFIAVTVASWNGYLGRVRVYQRSDTGWTQFGSDIVSNVRENFFGKKVRLVRNTAGTLLVFVSAPYDGSVHIYQWSESNWIPYGSVVTAGPQYTGSDEFGFDIDVSENGNRLVVGARCFDNCRGAVQVFEFTEGDWFPLGQILYGFSNSYFGETVRCNDDCSVLAVGSPEDCGQEGCGGVVYLFKEVNNKP